MAKIIVTYTAQFQGQIEIDTDQYEGMDIEDILSEMTHEQLFAGCETDISTDVEDVETLDQ
jgi:hypothetical protein